MIPLWKRPLVTKFCFDELIKLISESKHDIKVTCAISESYYEVVCKAFGFGVVHAENNPLGTKINTGIKKALESEFDYLMMMNSDNVIKRELIDDVYEPFFESLNPYFGIDRVTYVNFGTTDARDFSYEFSVLGIAKMLRRDVVELAVKAGGPYNPLRNKGLDDGMMDNLIHLKVFPTMVKYKGQLAMDFKSETNIWPWDHFKNKGKAVCYNHQ